MEQAGQVQKIAGAARGRRRAEPEPQNPKVVLLLGSPKLCPSLRDRAPSQGAPPLESIAASSLGRTVPSPTHTRAGRMFKGKQNGEESLKSTAWFS